MGILYPISKHINDQLLPYKKGTKPEWAMTAVATRAYRYALAFAANQSLVLKLNKVGG